MRADQFEDLWKRLQPLQTDKKDADRRSALAREATTSGDRIAAENFYQHAEHYFRINNARRETNQQGTPSRPTTPADVEMSSSEADSREVDVDRFQPQWDEEDSVSSETSTR